MAIHLNHPCHCIPLTAKPPKTALHSTPRLTSTTTTKTFRVHAAASNARELIQSGAVKAIRASEAWAAVSSEGFVLLDIRPAWEREKVRVTGSVHVPLFLKDEDNGPLTLLKKWVHFGYIGLWTGQYFTTLNDGFVKEVEMVVPDKSTRLLVACGEGLRSMMAISKLHEAEYKNLGWLAGGFNQSEGGNFTAVEGPEKLEYATIGGVSYIFLQLLILLRAVGNKKAT